MKTAFGLSAERFLDALSRDIRNDLLLNHVFDEANRLAIDPYVDMVKKLFYQIPYEADVTYKVLWGEQIEGRAFWYIYDDDEDNQVLRIHNIGNAGTERPHLSRV